LREKALLPDIQPGAEYELHFDDDGLAWLSAPGVDPFYCDEKLDGAVYKAASGAMTFVFREPVRGLTRWSEADYRQLSDSHYPSFAAGGKTFVGRVLRFILPRAGAFCFWVCMHVVAFLDLQGVKQAGNGKDKLKWFRDSLSRGLAPWLKSLGLHDSHVLGPPTSKSVPADPEVVDQQFVMFSTAALVASCVRWAVKLTSQADRCKVAAFLDGLVCCDPGTYSISIMPDSTMHARLVVTRGFLSTQAVFGLGWPTSMRKVVIQEFRDCVLTGEMPLSRFMLGLCQLGNRFASVLGQVIAEFSHQLEEFADWPSVALPWMEAHLNKDGLIDHHISFGDTVHGQHGYKTKAALAQKGFRVQAQLYTIRVDCLRYLEACRLAFRNLHFASIALDGSRISGREKLISCLMDCCSKLNAWGPLMAAGLVFQEGGVIVGPRFKPKKWIFRTLCVPFELCIVFICFGATEPFRTLRCTSERFCWVGLEQQNLSELSS
jgi:hypothetical protein